MARGLLAVDGMTSVDPRCALQAIAQILHERRAAIDAAWDITFLLPCTGLFRLALSPEGVALSTTDDLLADVMVLTNAVTLGDFVTGRFDFDAPAAEHVWVWSGEVEVWRTLVRALETRSWLSIRAAG